MRSNSIVFLFFLFFSFSQSHAQYSDNEKDMFLYRSYGVAGLDYNPSILFFKLKEEYRDLVLDSVVWSSLKNRFNLNTLQAAFPYIVREKETFNHFGFSRTDLTRIWEVAVSPYISGDDSRIFSLMRTGFFEWVEPEFFVHPLSTVPNDALVNNQWYLSNTRVFDAWDSTQGSNQVTIAILDGGTSLIHGDLTSNIALNVNDPIDGLDNDFDGFTDNYYGWNTGDWNNDVRWDFPNTLNETRHGTRVSSVSSATTNNNIGVAGIGWNCRYLPIKIVRTQSSPGWSRGYQGIVYAANYGVDVINCSWGSTYPSQLGREAVRYAVWDKQTLVVAAAGNSNNSVRLYPAAFEEVLSVTGTGGANEKWPSASFYEEVRLSAPGGNIEVASENSGYTSINGTSFASPIVSGIAGLLKSYYPSETSLQAGARMESSSYFIDTIPSNSSFVGKLGFGRVDAYSAINQVAGPWLKYIERQYDSQRGDGIVLAGDSLYLKGFLLNFLAAAPAGLTVLIQSDSPYLQWVDSTYTPFQVSGNNSVHVQTSSFKGYVLINCPENHLVSFTVKFFYNGILAGTSRFSYFLNPDFYNWTQNEIQMGVSNSGRLGFSDANSRRGIGLRRSNGANYLLEQFYSPFSFMIGRSGNVSNATIASSIPTCCPLPVDQHFQSLEPIRIDRKEGFGIQRIRSRFNDSNFGNNAIGVEVTRYVYGDTVGILKNVLFMDHFIHNAGNQAISDFKFGYYCDMDVPDNHLLDTPNLAYWDSVYRMGVHVHVSGGNGAGFVMAHNNPVHYYAFDVAGGNGSIRINDGFTQSEKWQSMSSGILRGSSSPTYAAQYLGSECDTLASQSCYFFPFAIVIGDSLSELRQAAQAALNHYSVYNIWTGKAGTDNWHDSGNWSKLQVPTSSDKVFIVRPSIPGGFMPVIKDADGYAGYVETLCGGDLYIINGRNLWVGP